MLLAVIWDEYTKVVINKAKLRDLLGRCNRVIGAIKEELCGRQPFDIVEATAKLMRQDIPKFGEQLSKLTHIQITAAVDLREYQEGLDRARIADQEALGNQLERLDGNVFEVLRQFDIVHNRFEAMVAIQHNLLRRIDNSPEERILQSGLASLQNYTGKKVPDKIPPWTITAYDVEIDPAEVLGRGGFGLVRKGRWNHLTVAVKQMTKETDQKTLLREIRIWSRLHHPHILPFLGASIAADPPFIVSLYMPNGDVKTYLLKHPNTNRVQLVHEIALGMLYIHGQNIVHGDLKAVNVLIDDSLKARIADFGLSEIKQQATTIQAVQTSRDPSTVSVGPGTLRYMSPEALQGVITKASDVYAFAMTVYEIFTNTPPFRLVPDAAIYNHISGKRLDQPTEPLVVNRGLDGPMWTLILESSEPLAAARPKFNTICELTELLAETRRHTLGRPVVQIEPEDTRDIFDLIGQDEEPTAKNWLPLVPSTPNPDLPFGIGSQERVEGTLLVGDSRNFESPSIPVPGSLEPDFWEDFLSPSSKPLEPPVVHGKDDQTNGAMAGGLEGDTGLDVLSPSAILGRRPERISPISTGNDQRQPSHYLRLLEFQTIRPADGQYKWSQFVSEEVRYGMTQHEQRKQSVIFELICSEMRYTKDLEAIDKLYIQRLRDASPPILAADDLERFILEAFWNVSDILAHHVQLLAKLQEIQREEHPQIRSIMAPYLEAVSAWQGAYMEYIPHSPISTYSLKRLSDNRAFRAFDEETQWLPELVGRQMRDVMARPVQRMARYQALLNDFKAMLTPEDDDFNMVDKVLDDIMDLARDTDLRLARTKRQVDAVKKYSPKLVFSAGREPMDKNLLQNARLLVHSGTLLIRREDEGLRDVAVMLFDNCLIITTKAKDESGGTKYYALLRVGLVSEQGRAKIDAGLPLKPTPLDELNGFDFDHLPRSVPADSAYRSSNRAAHQQVFNRRQRRTTGRIPILVSDREYVR
ncbi:hypothetical protein FRB98_006805 [Tulasnella sp. 332]|nr:hypothetical protein FRB98_006805 [Tulasnella sp. 332]